MNEDLPPRYRHPQLILVICCLSLFIVTLDATVTNVALPSIGKELHAGVASLQWTLDAYTLTIASFLVLAGSSGDRFGRRRVFQTGLVIFGVGSILCSLACRTACSSPRGCCRRSAARCSTRSRCRS